jgi:hypothetical protein
MKSPNQPARKQVESKACETLQGDAKGRKRQDASVIQKPARIPSRVRYEMFMQQCAADYQRMLGSGAE